jgi:hypothetical protein
MAVVTQVSAESIVGGIVKPKRVKKAIVKVDKSEKGLKTLTNLDNCFTIPQNYQTMDTFQPTMANIASKMDEIIPKMVKKAKPRSKKGSTIEITAENTPSTLNMEPILKTTPPTNGAKEIKVPQNSVTDMILESKNPIRADNLENALTNLPKKTAGRPRGSLDKVKRHALGDKPLGRPLGSKDSAPRKRRIGRPNLGETVFEP